MCGIAGILGRADEAAVARMLDTQKHRGPDGRQIWSSSAGYTVGHDRLAIIDLVSGDQPLTNEDGTLWLAVNGEIYNYRELRRELEGRHTFRTTSDAEVILHLFEEDGPECVRRLDGMFAIALWGPETGLFLARDPIGIKPLYHGYDAEGNLCFASEIKALADRVPELKLLPNGAYWMVGKEEPVRYYEVPQPQTVIRDAEQAMTMVERTLNAAVKKRLVADVPVGVFLSGGLDSSLVAAIVRRHVKGDLHSFAVGMEGSPDLLNARRVAEDLGTIHHERVLTPAEIISALPVVIDKLESCDPALVRSAIPTYFVSEMAARYVKVVLTGEGADELFAGYHYLTEFEPDWKALSAELRHITCGLHNSNLQRADRMSMAHGLEARVPFLDTALVDVAFQIDPALKRRDGEGKWVLRKVAERYLSEAIVWRKKEKFSIGTGIGPMLQEYAQRTVTEAQLAKERPMSDRPFASREEWLYWSLFRSKYGREDVLVSMGRSRSLNPGERWVSAL